MAETPKNVSKVPPITPKLLEANAKEQEKWSKMYAVPEITPDEYAAHVIQSNLAILDALETQKNRGLSETRKRVRAKIRELRHDTAIWLASVGKFEAAAKLAVSKHDRRTFKAYHAADIRDDAEWCEHPIFEEENGNFSQIAYSELDFHSENSGKRVSMVRCNVCGFRNAKDLNAELQKMAKFHREREKSGEAKAATIPDILRA